MELKKKIKRFSRQFIMGALAEVELGFSRMEVCKKHDVGYRTLCGWVTRYGSKELLETTRPCFTDQQKRSIVRGVVTKRMTIPEANLTHRIRGMGTIKRWIRGSEQDNTDIDLKQSTMPMPISTDPTQQDLQQALKVSQLKILALETMIDVAEQELNIKIRKKPGAKQ
jgi:transposase